MVAPVSKPEEIEQFRCIFAAPYYSLYEYQEIVIHLPMDMVQDDGSIVSVYCISQATYSDTNKSIESGMALALEDYLTKQALSIGINIIIE